MPVSHEISRFNCIWFVFLTEHKVFDILSVFVTSCAHPSSAVVQTPVGLQIRTQHS